MNGVLHTLELQDFAIADQLLVELRPGLNVLTGETGAGKSLLVDALALLAGRRADTAWIRGERPSALVQVAFGGPAPLTASRRLVREGRNMARLDGEVVSVAELQAELGTRLAIFGQHAYQTLLEAAEQRTLLDRGLSAEGRRALESYRRHWNERETVRAELAGLRAALQDRAKQQELLRFELEEIETAAVQSGETQSLEARLSVLRQLDQVRQGVLGALAALSEAEPSAADHLAEASRSLAGAVRFDPGLQALSQELADVLAASQAIASELERAMDRLEAEPGELDRLEARRAVLRGLERKHGEGADALLRKRDQLSEALAQLRDMGANDAALSRREQALTAVLSEEAAAISHQRAMAAQTLQAAVTAVMAELALPHARFEVGLTPLQPLGPEGAESVAFSFSANLGESLAPLREVASGGELSRVMLALNAAAGSDTPTLVFDEVDAGIGGRSGRAVGSVLRRLAAGRQVLVVTHLAQVAAFADHHLRVDKEELEGRTVSRVHALTGVERLRELARMLAGDQGEAALEHARTLLTDPELDDASA